LEENAVMEFAKEHMIQLFGSFGSLKRISDAFAKGIFAAVIAIAGAFLLVPVVIALIMAFDSRPYLAPFPPPSLSLRWFQAFFADEYYLKGLQTSITLAIVSAAISTAIGVGAAIYIDRHRFFGQQALATFFTSPQIVPAVIMGFSLLMTFQLLGVESAFVRLIGAHVIITIPYTFRTTLASLTGISPSYHEAALTLGANESDAFLEIILPLARTGIVSGALFAFAMSMDDVAVALFLTDPYTYTLPVALISQMRSHFDLTIAAASAVLVLVTACIVILLSWTVGLHRLIGTGVYRS
jgi:putative spermidine/putrescine transport system permease protein